MSFGDLPQINERKAQSKLMMEKLNYAISDCIEKLELENGYKFESYEINAVLLERALRTHNQYITSQFGYDTID